jgi:hypothetical protein
MTFLLIVIAIGVLLCSEEGKLILDRFVKIAVFLVFLAMLFGVIAGLLWLISVVYRS